MFTVIGLMLLGLFIGRVFQKKKIGIIQKLILPLIWILLFLLGMEVGSNQEITGSLHTLGLEAAVIALFATLGSAFTAKILWNHIQDKSKKVETK